MLTTASSSPPQQQLPVVASRGVPAVRPGMRDDDDLYMPIDKLRKQYQNYITGKQQEIEEQKEARRYYHGAQIAAEDAEILRKRRQPIIIDNKVGRKINGIVGQAESMRQDPKGYPRNPNNEEGAEVATAVVRYICDANEWKTVKPECLRQAAIEGIGGIELRLSEGDNGDPDIELHQIAVDDFFYDPTSAKPDFTDARYMGIAKWLHIEAAVELFPEHEEDLRDIVESGSDLTTSADREYKWIWTSQDRLRLVEHWYKKRNTWFWAFYVGTTLLDEGESPFKDQRNRSMCRFIMFSAAVDHDGDRYGFVRQLKGMQDEVNQRRSKALHLSNSRRLIADKGAVDDVETARIEWSRPDGYIEKNPGREITPDNTQADLASQLQFMEQAENSIESFANMNPAALAGPGVKNLSGRAVNMLQKPGQAELGPFLIAYRGWCIRTYRAAWNIAQSTWQAERWVRVTNDQKVASFLQINGMEIDQQGRPALVNVLGALDVDIILDEGPDVVNMMADTFDVLSQMPPGSVPPKVLIKLMPIAGSTKDELLQDMQPPPPDPVQQQKTQLELQNAQAKIQETEASTMHKRGQAISSIASAAHRANQAHLDAAQFARDGLQNVDVAPGQSGASPIAPQTASLTPQQVPGAPALPLSAPLAAHLMQHLQQQQAQPAQPAPARPAPPPMPTLAGFGPARVSPVDGQTYVRHLGTGQHFKIDHANPRRAFKQG